jgi:hypothetical protein
MNTSLRMEQVLELASWQYFHVKHVASTRHFESFGGWQMKVLASVAHVHLVCPHSPKTSRVSRILQKIRGPLTSDCKVAAIQSKDAVHVATQTV